MKLIIRADASSSIGSGHVMRCLAIAQEWQALGGSAVFVCAEISQNISQLLKASKLEVRVIDTVIGSECDAQLTNTVASEYDAKIIVSDGYNFTSDYYQFLKKADLCLVTLDDYSHQSNYVTDVLINPDPSASLLMYANKISSGTITLLGPTYRMIRRDFIDYASNKMSSDSNSPKKVFMCFGGADPKGVLVKCLNSFKKSDLNNFEIDCIISSDFLFKNDLNNFYKIFDNKLIVHESTDSIINLMGSATISITAGGGTSWESCFLGVPGIILSFADNQLKSAQSLHNSGAAIYLGDFNTNCHKLPETIKSLINNNDKLVDMSNKGKELVDGQGAARISNILWKLSRAKY